MQNFRSNTIEPAGREAIQSAQNDHVLSLVYPFDWTGLEDFSYPLDSNGIPRVPMGRLGLKYNPITVAQYGLFQLQLFAQRKDEVARAKAMKCVAWLVDHFQDWQKEAGAWVYDYDLDFYGPRAPWISAMAQGQGISLLLRACQLNREDRLVDISHRAFEVFKKPVSNGGVASSFPDGGAAFEEFPTDPCSLVLNGNIFAILGIHDLAIFCQEQAVADLFDRAVAGLKRNLYRYDTGYWNLYDLHPTRRLASPMYVQVHVRLLEILANLTGDSFFTEYATQWRKYLTSPINRIRWLFHKSVEKMRLKL